MYIGKEPIVGNFQKCDAISVVNGQAAYTLQVSSTNVVPESANHMLVSLNGILQAPVTSFTVSGSTLTFASNLATGDVIDFVILLGNVLDLGVPSDASITNAKLASDVISGETDIGGAIADADLFLVDDGAGGTLRKSAASRLKTYIGNNTPAFFAYPNANQSISNNTTTKITFNTELFDSDNTFDNSSNHRWTPGVAGQYFIGYQLHSANHTDYGYSYIYKNGTKIQQSIFYTGADVDVTMLGFAIDTSDADDYYEIHWKQTSGGSTNIQGNAAREKTFFYGFKLGT